VTGGSSYTAGDGLNLTGSSFSVNNTVVRTSGDQTINGVKSFSSIINGNIAGNAGTATSLKDAPSVCGSGHYARGIDVSGNALDCTPVPEGNSYTAGNGLSLSSNKFSLAANGTANYLTKWTGTNTLGRSIIQESSDGYNDYVGIGTNPVSNASLSVGSNIRYGGFINQVGMSGGYRVFDGANTVKCPDASVGTNRECIFNPAANHSPVRGSVSTQGSFILDGYASAEWGNTGAFQGRASDSANMPSFSWRGSESEMGMYKAAINKLAFSTNGQEKMTIDSAGTLIVKNNSGNRMLNLTTNGSTGNIRMTIGNAGSASELDVGTIDPVYTIGGKKYATYMAGMVGIKEETNGVLSLSKQSAGLFMTKIDFKNAPESSDIWLFGKVTNLIGNRDHFDETTCLLTPNFAGQIWYEKDWANLSINIFARPDNINRDNVEVSYRLTAPRFDKIDRTNFSDSEGEGFNLDKLLK
jgi:hypothetical protein